MAVSLGRFHSNVTVIVATIETNVSTTRATIHVLHFHSNAAINGGITMDTAV
jgi:hypothetical protein